MMNLHDNDDDDDQQNNDYNDNVAAVFPLNSGPDVTYQITKAYYISLFSYWVKKMWNKTYALL